MKSSTRFPEITVAGNPKEMGQQLGEQARDAVRGFCEYSRDYAEQTCRLAAAQIEQVVVRSLEHAEQYAPHMVEELRGVASTADVSLNDLMLLQVRNQLRPSDDAGCTAVSLPSGGVRQGAILAQNWDADPTLDAFTVVLTRRPQGKPAALTCTQAGLISYLGFNAAGIGACVNTLPAPSREWGVPHYFTLRGLHEATSLESAFAAVDRAERAIPANIMLCTPQGPVDFEVTLEKVYQLFPDDQPWLTHSNHCVHESLQAVNEQFPELIQSYARKERIDQLLTHRDADRESVMEMLRDHEGYPRSICRHANDDPQHGIWTTVFSMVMEPAENQMFVSRGNPCEQPYERYQLVAD